MNKPDVGMKLPKFVESRSDLPNGKIVFDEKIIQNDDKNKFILYAPSNLQSGNEKLVNIVIILSEEFKQKNFSYIMEINTRCQKNGYKVKGTMDCSREVLKSLYEDIHNTENDSGNIAGVDTRNSDIGKYMENLISYSIAEKVSDIHILKRSRSSIRVRKLGQLVDYDTNVSNAFTERLSRVIYDIFATDKGIQFREDEFQSASVDWNSRGQGVKLRFQSLPTYLGGFDVVLRVLPIGTDEEKIIPLDKLGYSPQQVKMLLQIAGRPNGAVIIAGTTGSGKSTTLKNMLMFINNVREYRCKIYTIEDPPEYKIPFVSQIPVNREKAKEGESPFSEPLKATMRGDPDILMIGEIRDRETGTGLQKGTQSGHQMFSTVHAVSALGIVPRLKDFGVSSSILGSSDFLTGLIYQRLLPVLCPHCSIPFKDILNSPVCSELDKELEERLNEISNLEKDNIRVKGKGCHHCKNLGIIDRTVCAEIISPDLHMLNAFTNDDMFEAEYHWRSLSDQDRYSDNMTGKTVLEHALFKMRMGMVSPKDIEEMIDYVNFSDRKWKELVNIKKNK